MEHRRIVDSHSLAIKLYLHIHIENSIIPRSQFLGFILIFESQKTKIMLKKIKSNVSKYDFFKLYIYAIV